MKTLNICLSLACAGMLLLSSSFKAEAIPVLQLGIVNGTYDSLTETIITTSNQFQLVAYGNEISTSTNYFISIALAPKVGPAVPPGGIGSFKINNTTYDFSDMVYGNPPLETLLSMQGYDAGDLPSHGIFDTFFTELDFKFSGQKTASVNTQNNPGNTPVNGSGNLYYQIFNVDISSLLSGYNLHFDLYDETILSSSCVQRVKGKFVPIANCTPVVTDTDINKFAPFSHDAETRYSVPEPGALVLLGLGVLGLVTGRRRLQVFGQQ